MQVIYKLHAVLNMIKGYEAGYTTKNSSEMLISTNGRTYKLSLEKVEDEELTLDMIDKYL